MKRVIGSRSNIEDILDGPSVAAYFVVDIGRIFQLRDGGEGTTFGTVAVHVIIIYVSNAFTQRSETDHIACGLWKAEGFSMRHHLDHRGAWRVI